MDQKSTGRRSVRRVFGSAGALIAAIGLVITAQSMSSGPILSAKNAATYASGPTVAQVAYNEGWRDSTLVTAVAISYAESTWQMDSISATHDYGLWQINKAAHPQYDFNRLLTDPQYNAQAALDVYRGAGGSWSPWSTYKSGAYQKYLGIAQTAVDQFLKGGAGNPTPTPDPRNATNMKWLGRTYGVLLRTQPNPLAQLYWANQLNKGATCVQVAQAMITTNGSTGPMYRNQVVTDQYTYLLGHAPDAGGLSYWAGQLNAGMSIEELQVQLISSSEFYTHSGSTNSGFVGRLYYSILGRSASASDLNYWAYKVTTNGRSWVASSIVNSTEHLRNEINTWYLYFDGRSGTSSEVSFYTTFLQGGQTYRDQIAIAQIAGSLEAYLHAQQ